MQAMGFVFVGKNKELWQDLDKMLPKAPRKIYSKLPQNPLLSKFWPIYFIDLSSTSIEACNWDNFEQGQVVFLVRSLSELQKIKSYPANFLGILTIPVQKQQVLSLVQRASELFEFYLDVLKMTREISLEREILARKNALLSFLNRVLAKVNECLEVEKVFKIAQEELRAILPVESIGGVFWWGKDREQVQCFVPSGDPVEQHKWQDYLLELVQRFQNKRPAQFQLSILPIKSTGFAQEKVVLVPLKRQKQVYGALVLLTSQKQLGKDQWQVVETVCNYLGLSILNGLRFAEVKIKADRDGLTGLFNRAYFEEKLRQELKRHQRNGQKLSLLMLDIDYFKKINDTYGHLAGDFVLKQVAKLLQKNVRESDVVARYGGEEFVLLLPETDENSAWLLAERIRTKIEETYFGFQDKQINVTVSIGVTTLKPSPFTPIEKVIKEADQALYLAKKSGRNMVCVSGDLTSLPN